MTPKVELTDAEVAVERFRRESDQPAPMKGLGIALAALSIVGSVFAAGYNWRSVSIVETKESQIEEQYVRKDVLNGQFETLRYQLAELSRQIDEMRAEARARRP